MSAETKTAHTPGPLRASHYAVFDANGRCVALMNCESVSVDEEVTNAALFAAAPDLLEALNLALPYVERIASTSPTEMQRRKRQQDAAKHAVAIRAAIAKATKAAP